MGIEEFITSGVIVGVGLLMVVLYFVYVHPAVCSIMWRMDEYLVGYIAVTLIAVSGLAALYATNVYGWRSNESDFAALRELRMTTQGDSWLRNGVVVAKDGIFGEMRVVGLYLSNNQLVGRIPNSLARLDKLESLYLEGNHLRGCIPAALLRVPNNDLALLDLPFCETPPAPPPVSDSGIVSPVSDPCPPGEPCVALHGDKTETQVGAPIVLTFAAVNAITLPELTAQMVIPIPSGWVANSTEWTDACTALCNLTMKIPTGDNRTTRVEIYPNEPGDFSMRATLRWFAGEESDANANQRDEIINVRVK